MSDIAKKFHHNFYNGKFELYDKRGNIVYWETSYGFWEISEYNDFNQRIFHKSSYGYWERIEYTDGEETYFHDSFGTLRGVKRSHIKFDNENQYELR